VGREDGPGKCEGGGDKRARVRTELRGEDKGGRRVGKEEVAGLLWVLPSQGRWGICNA